MFAFVAWFSISDIHWIELANIDTNRDVHKCNVHCNVVSLTVKLSKPNESEVTVKARCYRSMKKNEQPYLQRIIFRKQDQPDVVSFSCSCAAGKGFCHHIAGLLFQLSHFKMLGLNAIPPVLSKTSKPQVLFFCFLFVHYCCCYKGLHMHDFALIREKLKIYTVFRFLSVIT